ncbi:putative protease [Duganella sp. CF517]|nr:putative protease [Duganella sp. CF517]
MIHADSVSSAAPPIELVCSAGSLPALKAAVDLGADCVYLGFRDATNARNFAGLNFDDAAIAQGIAYAHARGRKVLLALNTYP